jgi:type VI secretion system protein ImpK
MAKDVFGTGDNDDRTVMRPAGARLPAPPPSSGAGDDRTVMQPKRTPLEPGPARATEPAPVDEGSLAGRWPLAAAASRLLVLTNGLSRLTAAADLKALRNQLERELSLFRQTARRLDLDDNSINTAHYALCATIDDLVLSSVIGGESFWRKPSLVATFHNEVVSGDRLFDIAEGLLGDARPDQLPLLEVIYLCFSLGFEGRLRIDPRGMAGHTQMRERLHNSLRQLAGYPDPGLSPQWRGAGRAQQPLRKTMPWWVWWAGSGLAGLLLFSVLLFNQSLRLDKLMDRMALLSVAPASPYPKATVIKADGDASKVRGLLAEDIAAGRLEVIDRGDAIIIRLASSGMFASGSAEITSGLLPTLERVAMAAQAVSGTLEIQGHTDSVPIRSLRFPSNLELSQARAEGVAAFMKQRTRPDSKIGARGFGQDDPVGSNADEEGRSRNRRVDVLLVKTPGWQKIVDAAGQTENREITLPSMGPAL